MVIELMEQYVWPFGGLQACATLMILQNLLNWAHRSVDKHTTHKIDHTIYSAIEEWNSAKMACNCECFH